MMSLVPPPETEDLDDQVEDDVDHGRGALTNEELREVERFANECFAELRVGKPWREAWSIANQPDPDGFGPQDPPVRVKGKSWQDDALSAIFRAGPAPAERDSTDSGGRRSFLAVEGAKAPHGPVVSGGNPAGPATPAPRPIRALHGAGGLPPRVIPIASARSITSPQLEGPHMGQQDILDALAKGPLLAAAIADVAGMNSQNTSATLTALKKKGLLLQDGRGLPWRLASSSTAPSTAKSLEELAARRTKGVPPPAGRKVSRRPPESDAPPRKPKTPPNGMPWGISDAITIPAAPCKTRDHGELVDAMLTKRAELVTKFAAKVGAIDAAIRSFIEV